MTKTLELSILHERHKTALNELVDMSYNLLDIIKDNLSDEELQSLADAGVDRINASSHRIEKGDYI